MKKLLVIGLIIYIALMLIANFVHNPIKGEDVNYGLHFIEFFVLSALLITLKFNYFYSILISVTLSVVLEVSQIFISYRTFNYYDILAGVIGGFFILIFRK